MRKARWYASRGYPVSFIAEKLAVTRNTVRKWCGRYVDNRSLDRLVARVRAMPDDQRKLLIERTEPKKAA